MPREERFFQLGRCWIGRVPGSTKLYRFWYDQGARDVRRRSLATADIETAKTALAAIFLKEGDGRTHEPKDVTILAVLTSYWENHSDLRSNPSAARRSGSLLLDFLGDNTAKVSVLTKLKQIDFMKWLRARGLSVAYISRIQSVIAAALNRVTNSDDEEENSMLMRSPRIIVQPRTVAEILDAPEPMPRNWHPDIDQIAKFLDTIPPEEETRLMRFVILMLAFAARNEAIQQLRPFQIDKRHHLLALNPSDRRQTKKRRPTLPIPPAIWSLILSWCDAETLVHKDKRPVIVLRKPWRGILHAAELPREFTPYALRHFMATELRRRRVSQEQRERWMGHQPASMNDAYRVFDESYLSEASEAVNGFLLDLARACKKSPFRQVSVKSAKRGPRLKIISG